MLPTTLPVEWCSRSVSPAQWSECTRRECCWRRSCRESGNAHRNSVKCLPNTNIWETCLEKERERVCVCESNIHPPGSVVQMRGRCPPSSSAPRIESSPRSPSTPVRPVHFYKNGKTLVGLLGETSTDTRDTTITFPSKLSILTDNLNLSQLSNYKASLWDWLQSS